MAELLVGGAFLSAALNVLFDRLASRQVADFFRKKKLGEELLKKFKMVLLAVNVLLDDADMKEFSNSGVKHWLDELKDVIYNAEDILDEIATKSSKTKSGFKAIKIGARRVEKIIEKIENIASMKEMLGLRGGVKDSLLHRGSTTSLVEESFIYGRDREKEKIFELLLLDVASGDDEIPVITIVGMGGIGKTTLAKAVCNDEKVEEYFDIIAWVSVTKEFDVLRITKVVLDTVTSSHSADITDLNFLQLRLKQVLSGKKVLLVLDDVWNEDYSKWRTLCAPFKTAGGGCKIIVTTRIVSVASIMRTVPSLSLEALSDDNSWLLFANHAFGSTTQGVYPHLEAIGKKIVKKCSGLPLAAKTLGGVLRFQYDERDWENVLKSEIWDLPNAKSCILPALRLSYHYLPTHLKRCFAYCSIFPRDYEFVKKNIVLLWMAEGFVAEGDKSTEQLGEVYFDELFSKSFFQKSSSNESSFVMHDLIIDLARYVSGSFCLTLERSKASQNSEKVRHFSYSRGEFDVYNQFKSIAEAKYLRTFLPVNLVFGETLNICTMFCHDLLSNMKCIRVLSFSHYTNVVEVPDSVGSLVHLRYLDLSQTSIKSLPDTICQLYNLQTLLLVKCHHLIKLPSKLGDLINLRHLDISETSLTKMPIRMRRLVSLQTLSNFVVGKNNCSGLRELKGFQHLKGSLSISGLQNVTYVEDAMEATLKEKVFLQQLVFAWGKDVVNSNKETYVLDKLQPSTMLKHFTLMNYGGARFSCWLGDGSLFNLTYLKISNCTNCLLLPSLGQLPSLVDLYIDGITSVRRVDSEFYGNGLSSVKPFRKLMTLKFENMAEWEEWSASGGEGDDFPELQTLWIENCPKLCGNLPNHLPSMRALAMSGCSKLHAKIPGDASLVSLKLQGCQNVVFENMTSLSSLVSLDINLEGISTSFPDSMIENCNNLEKLNIREWSSLRHFPVDGLPPTLRTLKVLYCNNLEFLPEETLHNYKFLGKLRLTSSCDSMTVFPLSFFPNINYIKIEGCKNLESFSISDNHEDLKSLECLVIFDCDKLIDFPSGGLPAPNLMILSIAGCANLRSLPQQMNTRLTSLVGLIVASCGEIESFSAEGLPSNLQGLVIFECAKVMLQWRRWNLQVLPFLEELSIGGCQDTIESFPQGEWQFPTSITHLGIWDLPNLKVIDASKLLNLTSLKSMEIWHCPKVKLKQIVRNTKGLPISFCDLTIEGCPALRKQLRRANISRVPFLSIDKQG